MVDVAEIRLWGRLVGAVQWHDARQLASFEYDAAFLKDAWDIAPIKMPVAKGGQVFEFPELRKRKDETFSTFKGLPGLLADVLPDRYGNNLINVWLAEQGRAPDSMNPVEQLCFVGERGMGALEFEPARFPKNRDSFNIEVSRLVEVAHLLLSDRKAFKTNLKQNDKKALQAILRIGTSAGGARPKAVIAYNESTGSVRSGQAFADEGFEHWLLKLDGVDGVQFGESYGWGRVEYAYYLMAKACDIEMSKCLLLEENGRAHFMTKRFDREGQGIKHHIQTLCGIQHFDYNDMLAYSYEQVFQTMRLLRLSYPEAEQMFRRMVFNVLATNCDDHTKNFSFRLKRDEKWTLAPAYDVCYAYDVHNYWVSQQTLSVNGRRRDITKADLMVLAQTNNIKKGERIIDEINTVVKAWGDFASQAAVREDLQSLIQGNLHVL